MERVGKMVREATALGLETCTTLGMLDANMRRRSTTPGSTTTTTMTTTTKTARLVLRQHHQSRTNQDWPSTLAHVHQAGI